MAKIIGLEFETFQPDISSEKNKYSNLKRSALDSLAQERNIDTVACTNKEMVIALLVADDEATPSENQD